MRRLWKQRVAPIALSVCMMLSWAVPASADAEDASAAEQVQIYMGQQKTDWEQPPYIDNGNTMVPMRALFEKLGFAVTWDNAERKAIASKGDLSISLPIGSGTASVNQIQYYLDAAPVIREGSTYMPLRFVSEAAGAEVLWDSATHTVTVQPIEDAQQSIRHLIDHVTQSSSFLQRAVAITGGDGIKRNETEVLTLQMNGQGSSAEVTFEVGFTVSTAVKSDHGVTISPSESVVYEFKGEVYKDSAGQWLLRTGIDSLPYVLQEKKPFMDS
ncbi:copper amine oxidase N-terminal domain-containing protein [Paenibacillus sp. TAB 01]|uniref:copper amine oxidase N-terminal domain-containing protein n=1 Tax=Paenibacillus sp. TAB 01 TaxID=3368988 RepID=UPI003753BE7B